MFGWIRSLFETVTTAPPPVRLNLERCEGRETPATFFVALRSITTGEAGQTLATHAGSLDLNAANPSVPGGILVDAPSAIDAIRFGLDGRIGVRFNGEAYYYAYSPVTASGNWAADNTPFFIQAYPQPAAYTHVVQLEDRFGRTMCDWDYNDRWWFVDAIDVANPPASPPGTVGVTVPPVDGPKLEILNKLDNGMTDAKVAKWQDAYEKTDKVRVKTDFPTTDEDRFYLRVTDPYYAAHPNESPQTLRVWSDSDAMTNGLTLTRMSAGVYETRKCILVSNTVDDEYPVDGISDNNLDDPTYRVRLGDTLTISYDANPAGQISRPIIHKRVPVRVIKEAKVHVTVITSEIQGTGNNDTAKGFATQAQVDQWMTQANEAYAQVGVRLVWTTQFADQPKKRAIYPDDEDVILNNDPAAINNGLKDPQIPEWRPEVQGLLHGTRTAAGVSTPLRTAATDDVELFVINYFRSRRNLPDLSVETFENKGFMGYAFPAYVSENGDLKDSATVSAVYRDPFTVAHEIGHLLTDAGHTDEDPGERTDEQVESNLMRSGACQDEIIPPPAHDPRYPDWTTATKRLDESQQTAIWTKQAAIVKDFIP